MSGAGAMSGATYRAAGVDIDAGEEAVRRIRPHVARTVRPEVLGGIGGFGGCFELSVDDYRSPVLVSTTDGVGTKAEVARQVGRFDTIGVDLVAMCVDDLVCCGAEPLFFLDYLAVGRLDPAQVEDLVAGIADGCVRAGCSLVGGEMAEHPGVMDPGSFDLAGFAVGVVERDRLIDGSLVVPGDILIGLASPGLRSNGYSLARRVVADAGRSLSDPAWDAPDAPTLADELLRPSVIYAPAVRAVIDAVEVHAAAHITGGGLDHNLARVLPGGVEASVDRTSWAQPRIFGEIQRWGGISDEEMGRVFNLGIGMVLVVPPGVVDRALEVLAVDGHGAAVIGGIVAAPPAP